MGASGSGGGLPNQGRTINTFQQYVDRLKARTEAQGGGGRNKWANVISQIRKLFVELQGDRVNDIEAVRRHLDEQSSKDKSLRPKNWAEYAAAVRKYIRYLEVSRLQS